MGPIQEFWGKLNANERIVGYGAGLGLVAWIISILTPYGFGGGYAFVSSIVVLVVYWLKYAPNSNITWPAPVPTIVLIVTGLGAIFMIPAIGLLGGGLFSLWGLSFLLSVIAVLVMVYGAWMEYQANARKA